MSQINKELKLCGVFECNYTNTGGEIIHISPTSDYYEKLSINETITKVLFPYYIDVNFDGINQFERQYHIVLRFNNTSDNIMAKLHRMYVVHEGIPVQVHSLNCYLLGKTTKISNDMKLSLLGSSTTLKNKPQYYKSIRVVIKIDNPEYEEENTRFHSKNSIRIMLDYFVDSNDLIESIRVIKNDIKNINCISDSPEESEEVVSETCSEYYSFAPILMPTMGHR